MRLNWVDYGKLSYVMINKISTYLKSKIYNKYILPVTSYGNETYVRNKRTCNTIDPGVTDAV